MFNDYLDVLGTLLKQIECSMKIPPGAESALEEVAATVEDNGVLNEMFTLPTFCIETPTISKGTDLAVSCLEACKRNGNKLIWIGNGGSAAIASHSAIDYWKNGGIKSIDFNQGPLLTCIGNDYGYPAVFEKPIEMFADENDVLVAISSSGQSENIINGVRAAKEMGCTVITMSGFLADNPLRSMGDMNYYVPSSHYGHVELVHQILCHSLLDLVLAKANGRKTW